MIARGAAALTGVARVYAPGAARVDAGAQTNPDPGLALPGTARGLPDCRRAFEAAVPAALSPAVTRLTRSGR